MTAPVINLALVFLHLLPIVSAGLFRSQSAPVSIQPDLQLPDYESQFEVISLTDPPHHESHRSLATTEKPYFTVREIERQLEYTSPADVHIKIFNHSPDKWYSVTIVSHGEYTGTANFLRQVMDRPGTPLLYSWIPKFRGSYEIIVHELALRDTSSYTPPIEGEYKFNVVDKPGFDSRQFLLNEIDKMPPCSMVHDRIDLYTVWDGSWIGPNMHGGHTGMRTGWYFLPSRDMFCKIEYFTDEELRRNVDERSIYILGSSKERGVFLSLVDMILDTKEKEHLNESVIAKCWGRAFVLKNNLKVFYQDWRSNYFQNVGSSDYLCHNDKVVREGGTTFTENGLKVWEEIFQDRSSWPSVILMSTGNQEGFYGEYDLQHFINTLPSTWQGTLLLTDGAFSGMRAGNGDEAEYIRYRNFIKELVYGLKDKRVRWIDGKGISKEHRMYGEFGPDHVTGSQHFHAHCKSSYLDESGTEQSMKICSNVTEVLGQLLIDYALGPKEEYLERIEGAAGSLYNGNKELMYCHACPEDLLPFHITHHPEMTCAAGVLHARSRTEFHSGTPQICPEKCFDIPPSKEIQTQSGVVNERNCPVEYFMQSPDSNVENLEQMNKEIDQLEQEMKQMTKIDQAPPPDQTNQQEVAPQEQANQNMPPEQANQAQVIPEVRQTDFAQGSPEVNDMASFFQQEDTDMSTSSYNLWLVNLFFIAILAFCYQSKIKTLLRDGIHNTDNPYTSLSRLSFHSSHDGKPSSKKYAIGAGTGLLFGLICVVNFPPQNHKNQSLRNTSVIPNSIAGLQLQSNAVAISDRRPVMTTFFEPVEGGCCGMSEEGHRNLVKAWEASWQSLGWDTKVYNAADAEKHPKFELAAQKLRDVGMNEYDQRCFWRWLAAAYDDDPMGGWQSDYDTFPLSLTAEKGLELMKQPGFKSWTRHVPSLLHGDQASWNKILDIMIDHIRDDLDFKYRISDMVIIMYLRDHYDLLNDLGITVWEGLVYPGFPYHPDDVKPTIDCDTANQFLAAHISHASSQTDYNEKHTYPKLEGKGAVILPENVHYSAENRAEAGTIMMEDYKRECMGNGN